MADGERRSCSAVASEETNLGSCVANDGAELACDICEGAPKVSAGRSCWEGTEVGVLPCLFALPCSRIAFNLAARSWVTRGKACDVSMILEETGVPMLSGLEGVAGREGALSPRRVPIERDGSDAMGLDDLTGDDCPGGRLDALATLASDEKARNWLLACKGVWRAPLLEGRPICVWKGNDEAKDRCI